MEEGVEDAQGLGGGGQRLKRTIDVEPLWSRSIMEEGMEDAQGMGGGGRG